MWRWGTRCVHALQINVCGGMRLLHEWNWYYSCLLWNSPLFADHKVQTLLHVGVHWILLLLQVPSFGLGLLSQSDMFGQLSLHCINVALVWWSQVKKTEKDKHTWTSVRAAREGDRRVSIPGLELVLVLRTSERDGMVDRSIAPWPIYKRPFLFPCPASTAT
jgi:hypothetical protein